MNSTDYINSTKLTLSTKHYSNMTHSYSNKSYVNDRSVTINWLKENNYPVIPVAPAQDGDLQKQFTGKNPSYLDKDGKPYVIQHSQYQDRLPTENEINMWFAHSDNGVGTLGGWNNTIWIDIDVKQFDSQNDCDIAFKNLLENHPELLNTFTERTQSGGYRIGVKVKQMPNFTNITLQPNGDHIGEALGKGRFTVLSPTVGISGNHYLSVQRVPLIEVHSLESIGIYSASKKRQETTSKKEATLALPSTNTSAITLELLGSETSQNILKGNAPIKDRSDALTTVIREWYGWENWLKENDINYSGTTYELAHELGKQLDIDDDRIERIIGSVDSDSCLPAILVMTNGDKSSCWQKIRKLDNNIYEHHCPDNIKQEIQYQIGSDSQCEYEPVIKEIERILQIEDPGKRLWDMEGLSKRTKFSTKKLIEIYNAKLEGSQHFAPRDVHDFLASTPEERKWLIAAHISEATTVLLYADGGVGKTLLAYDLVKAVASGQAWNGYITKQGRVLIIQTDEPEIDTSERLKIAGFQDIPKGVINIETNWQFSQIRQLKQWIECQRPVFVVIDSLTSANRTSSAEEKDTAYATVLYELRDIANEFKCSIMVLHHENKNGGTRGTTAICNNVSEVWRLRKGEPQENLSATQRVLEIGKSRSGCTGNYQIELDVDNYSWKHQGNFGEPNNASKSLKDKLLGFLEDQPGKEYTVEKLASEFNSNKETVRRNLEKLCQSGQIQRKMERTETKGGKQKATVYFAPVQQTSAEPCPVIQSE